MQDAECGLEKRKGEEEDNHECHLSILTLLNFRVFVSHSAYEWPFNEKSRSSQQCTRPLLLN